MKRRIQKTKRAFAVFLMPIFLAQTLSLNMLFLASPVHAQTEPILGAETLSGEPTSASQKNPAIPATPSVLPQDKPVSAAEPTPAPDAKTVPVATDKTPVVEPKIETIPTVTEPKADVKSSPAELPKENPVSVEKPAPVQAQIVDQLKETVKTAEAPKLEWSTSNNGKKSTTSENVELGRKYVAPQNDQVTVTFTKLPENPGVLSIEEIVLSDEQVKSLGALSNVAYDITSTMKDGTFKYDLTLPKPKDEKNVQIKYAENVAGLENAGVISKDDLKNEKNSVSATLDHFTIFLAVAAPLAVVVPVVTKINILPQTATIEVGQVLQFTGSVLDQNGATMLAPVAWTSSNSSIGVINGATGTFTALSAGTVTITASSGAVSSVLTMNVTAIVPTQNITTVIASPSSAFLNAGGTKQLSYSIYDQNGVQMSTAVVLGFETWTSSNPAIATVDANGLVSAVANGTATITVSLGTTQNGNATIVVGGVQTPTLSAINVTPANAALVVGGTQQFTAATLDQNNLPIVAPIRWTSSSPAVGSINATTGVFTPLTPGITAITATSGALVGVASATVSPFPVLPPPAGQFTITSSVTGINAGSISPLGSTILNAGATQTYAMTSYYGNYLADVIVDGVSVGVPQVGGILKSYTFTNVTANHTIIASFAPNQTQQLLMNISAGAGGTITPSGIYYAPTGSSQSFSITPDLGFHIVKTTVNGIDYAPSTTLSFGYTTTNLTVSVLFAPDTPTNNIVATVDPNATANLGGTISPNGITAVNFGANQTYTITPSAGFQIDTLSIDGKILYPAGSIGVPGTYTFTNVIMPHAINVKFIATTFNIVASAGPNGTISPLGTTVVPVNGNKNFIITPNPGYYIKDVLINGVSTYVGSSTTFGVSQVRADSTISAVFDRSVFNVFVTVPINGTITAPGATAGLIPGTIPVSRLFSRTIVMTPNANYHVADVLIDGISVGAVSTYTFANMNADHTIAAIFAIDTVNVTASTGLNGTINPSGTTAVPYGGSQTYNIIPNAGFKVANVLVNGVSVGAVTNYTFTNVVFPASIVVGFVLNPTIIVTPSTLSATTGATQQFTAVASGANGIALTTQPTFTWTSSNPAIGTVNQNTGLFSAVSVGTVTITAASGAMQASATITVTQPVFVLTSIQIVPANSAVSAGATKQFSAVGLDQFGTPLAVQPTFVWSSVNVSNPFVGIINPLNGVFSAIITGNATVTVASGAVSASTAITVVAPVLTGISISPANFTMTPGTTQQMSATVLDQFGVAMNPSPAVTWTSSNASIATVDPNSGIVTAQNAGTATINATNGAVSGSATVTINNPATIINPVVAKSTPVYRFWSNSRQGHFYTASAFEKDSIIANDKSWTFEGAVFSAFTTSNPQVTPIYRFWSPSKQHHFYTASAAEKDAIIANDKSWVYETIAFYAYANQQPNSTPVYRFWSNAKQGHFYTASVAEKNQIIATYPTNVWNYEGIAYYTPTN